MTGPMIASAAIHIGGISDTSPPSDFIAVAQIVMGSGAGARFSGVKPHELVRPMLLSGFRHNLPAGAGGNGGCWPGGGDRLGFQGDTPGLLAR